jgi:hypothetical protein
MRLSKKILLLIYLPCPLLKKEGKLLAVRQL